MFSAKTVQLLGPAPRHARAAAVVRPAAGAETSERFVHLDALRAGLMFWGILVHVSTVAPSGFFRACAQISGLVRMESFFIISGFLAYMLLQKYGGGKTVRKRLIAIGVPFVTAFVLLNPATKHLIFVYRDVPISFADYVTGKGNAVAHDGLDAWPGNWHLHLWFLLALFVYSLLAPLLGRAVDAMMLSSRERTPRAWTFGRLAPLVPDLKFLAICGMVSIACVGWRVAFKGIEPFLQESAIYVVRSIGNFLPYYALGMVLFASPALRAIFSKVHWVQTVLACGLLIGAHEIAGANPPPLYEVLILSAQTYVALCLSSLLFWVSQKSVRKENPTARFLSDAAYTVYLFHFLVIYLFTFLFRGLLPQNDLMLVAVAACTFLATVCLHAFIIRPVPVLAFLFNGKPIKRAK